MHNRPLIMSLALLALLVLGLSTARAENCVTVSMSCSRGLLLNQEDREIVGEAGWTGIVCGNGLEMTGQILLLTEIHCN